MPVMDEAVTVYAVQVLEGRIAELTARVEKMASINTGLMEAVEELRVQLVAFQPRGMRQASPSSDDRRSSKPKSSGRRPGGGRSGRRRPPPAVEIIETPGYVSVSGDACPARGGGLKTAGEDLAYKAATPVPWPVVRVNRMAACRYAGMRRAASALGAVSQTQGRTSKEPARAALGVE